MSEIRPLADDNFGTELNNCFGNELVGNSAFIKALEVVVLRNIPRLLIPIFEPLVRRVVKEEIELAQRKYSTSTNHNHLVPNIGRNAEETAINPPLRKLKLRFSSKLSLPILTGKPILGQNNSPLKIELIDEKTGLVVKLGPESSARVQIVVLRVDPKEDEGREWTSEKFDQNIVTENEKGKSLLTGEFFLNLNKGAGSVDEIKFTNGKIWSKKCDFMLGAKFVNSYDGIIVTEAKSEHFTLVDCRNTLYGKHYPPVLTDEVWRLKNIRKGGEFYKRLIGENIKTVGNFLNRYFLDRQRLQEILKMSDKVFAATVKHGLTCKRDNACKHIYHTHNTQRKAGVIFDAVGELLGILSENGFVSVDMLSEKDKDDARISVASAFENWGDVECYYDSESSRPSSSTNPVLPNYLLCSPTHENPSPFLGTPHHTTTFRRHTIFQENLEQNVVYGEIQPAISLSEGNMSPNNPSTYSMATDNNTVLDLDDFYIQPSDMEFLRECLSSPLCDPEPDSRVFNDCDNMFDHSSVVEDSNCKEQRTWIRRWLKMVLVVRFFLRMRRMEKTDHVQKRMRIR